MDPAPRPEPPLIPLVGAHVTLEPLGPEHVAPLWEAAAGAEASWTYMVYGPFPSAETLDAHVALFRARPGLRVWAVVPRGGEAAGWLALMDIQPANAAIELGHIWFAPRLRRTRAATEAMLLPLRLAADALGYRRLVWKCDALNAASRRAAERLGFTYEGTLRAHMVVKGRLRDTAMYSIVGAEWPARRDAAQAWLAPDNWADGRPRRPLADFAAGR